MATALLTNETTNTSGSASELFGGGYKIIRFRGTFDGATVTIDCDFGDGNWVAADDTGRTTTGVLYLSLAPGMRIRATTSGVGASTDLTVDYV